MTSEQKKQLHAALMEHVGIQLEPGSFEWRIYDESASEDIGKLEPFIDEMLQQAENRGRLVVYLEVAASTTGPLQCHLLANAARLERRNKI